MDVWPSLANPGVTASRAQRVGRILRHAAAPALQAAPGARRKALALAGTGAEH
jgi:hypothetical protein